MPDWPKTGRLLGVDFGAVRVGLAITDPDRIIASPLTTLVRQNTDADAAAFVKLIADEKIAAIVVGLPISLNGTEGPKAREAREFGTWLAQVTQKPVVYWDERFTSSLADDAMLAAGLTKQKRKDRRDRVAAQLILQGYLEAGCPPPD